jgi:hypothetical protein
MAPDARAVQVQERLRRLRDGCEATEQMLRRSRALVIAGEVALGESYRRLARSEARRLAASRGAPEAL